MQPSRCNFMSGLLRRCSSYVLAACSLAGCSGPDEDESQTLQDTDDPHSSSVMDASIPQSGEDGGAYPDASDDAGSSLGDASISKPNDRGAAFASVRANGTGCPPGSTDVSISPDGKRMVVHFASFEAAVDKNKSVDIKDCQLGIKLKSPKGFSFSVVDFLAHGYAYLAKGQTARQLTKYYFQGAPQQNQREARTELSGPFDDTYSFRDSVGVADAVWSPCGAERDLNIRMTLRLQNASNKTDGYINVETLYDIRFNWRYCK